MNQSAAASVGNALEVMEVMRALSGETTQSILCKLTAELGGEILWLAGMAKNSEAGAEQIAEAIRDGSAAERFGRMVAELGGPVDFVERWRDRLPAAPITLDVYADRPGFVNTVDGQMLGFAVVHLGGGRLKGGDTVDPAVGLSDVAMIGDEVDAARPLARIHAATQDQAEQAERAIRNAYHIDDIEPDHPPLIYRSIR